MSDVLEAFLRDVGENIKVAVVGDVMLDEHVECQVLGISPEDDLAWKLKILKSWSRPGGAANVAMNLKSLGADVALFGAVGFDRAAEALGEHLDRAGIKFTYGARKDRITSVKRRYMTQRGKHICRVDNECFNPIYDGAELAAKVLAFAPEVIVVSDYAKGVITHGMIEQFDIHSIPYIVDPKDKPFSFYGNAAVFTPNLKEFYAIQGADPDETMRPYDLLRGLEPDNPGQHILVKMGGNGADLYSANPYMWEDIEHYNVRTREVGDPAGCGDSLIAGLAFALSLGWPMDKACRLAVAAGACAYDHTGVYSVTRADLERELGSYSY